MALRTDVDQPGAVGRVHSFGADRLFNKAPELVNLKGRAMTKDEMLKTLQQLSKRTGFSIQEIAYMARMIAQTDYDPLPPEKWGEPFEFPERRINVTGDNRDFFDPIHAEIPKPNAQVDLWIAWKRAQQDQKAIAAILARSDLSLAALFQIYTRLLEWERFLAVRIPILKCAKLLQGKCWKWKRCRRALTRRPKPF